MKILYFWQIIISPHMADLADALSQRGYRVTYVAQRAMSDDRASQGWHPPVMPGVTLKFAESDEAARDVVREAPARSVHICQGVRANGMVRVAQIALETRGLQQWVVMETVDDSGWRGAIKRIEYSRIFRARRRTIQGVLATGHRTAEWVNARGVPKSQIFPFAYFLPNSITEYACQRRQPGPFRFVFAGRLIALKRVDWLIKAFAGLKNEAFELWLVGTGPDEAGLRAQAANQLGARVHWLGQLPLPEVPAVMAQADCLVLPSVHDGWGAVASEALMVGTPVVCSDACGVAGVVFLLLGFTLISVVGVTRNYSAGLDLSQLTNFNYLDLLVRGIFNDTSTVFISGALIDYIDESENFAYFDQILYILNYFIPKLIYDGKSYSPIFNYISIITNQVSNENGAAVLGFAEYYHTAGYFGVAGFAILAAYFFAFFFKRAVQDGSFYYVYFYCSMMAWLINSLTRGYFPQNAADLFSILIGFYFIRNKLSDKQPVVRA